MIKYKFGEMLRPHLVTSRPEMDEERKSKKWWRVEYRPHQSTRERSRRLARIDQCTQ